MTLRATATARAGQLGELVSKVHATADDASGGERAQGGWPRHLGVIDLGTNTFHLTVAAMGADQSMRVLVDAKIAVRLASVLVSKRLDADEIRRADAALRVLIAQARDLGEVSLCGVATSALREADNGARFVAQASDRHRVPIEILEPEEEARLVWSAASSELASPSGPVVVIDLGGGSAELAVGAASDCSWLRSVPLGVLRLRHRHIASDGILRAEDAERIAADVWAHVAPLAPDVRRAGPEQMLLTGGTARALGKIVGRVDNVRTSDTLGRAQLRSLVSLLTNLDPHALSALGVPPDRLDTLGPGAVVLETLMQLMGFESVRVCRRGLREGLLMREARRAGAYGPTT